VNLYRQTKVVGGLFGRSGKKPMRSGSAYALDRAGGCAVSLDRNLGSMLVQGAKADRNSCGSTWPRATHRRVARELNIHYGDSVRGFVGRSPTSATWCRHGGHHVVDFKLRGGGRVGLVYVGDGAHRRRLSEGLNLRGRPRCPLVVIVEEQRIRVLDADREGRPREIVSWSKAVGYGIVGERADGNRTWCQPTRRRNGQSIARAQAAASRSSSW